MNRSAHLLTIALALTLTGCTGSTSVDPGSLPTQTGSSVPTATSTPAASPSGESTPAPEPTGSVVGTEDNSSATPQPEPSDPGTVPERDLNDHGNLAETVGEASVFDDGSGTTFADMKAEEIQVDFQCTGDSPPESINGQFVALHFSVAAHPELVDSGWPYFAMSAREFKAWDADGQPVDDPVGNSAGCVAPDELLPSPIEPETDAEGLIVLDVPAGSGSAGFVIGGFEGSYGWEWSW